MAHAGGRPTKYRPEMIANVLLSAVRGATDQAIAEACGIDVATVCRWCEVDGPVYKPEFREAVTRAKEEADAAVLNSLYKSAIGYDYTEQVGVPGLGAVDVSRHARPEVPAQKSWLANRLKSGWVTERRAMELSGPGGKPVEVNVSDVREEVRSRLTHIASRLADEEAPEESCGDESGGTDGAASG